MKTFLGSGLLLGVTLVPLLTYAQGFTPLTNLPGLTDTLSSDTLPAFLNQLYKLCIGAAAVIAVLQIMRAGTKYFFYTGSVTQNQEAKKLIMNSLLGLLLVLSPAIVFGIINPDILNLSLDFSELEPEKIATTTNSQGRDNRCELYSQADIQVGWQSCSTLGEGFQPIASECCAGSQAGSVCCARPKTDPQQTANQYMWRYTVQNSPTVTTPGTTFGTPPPPPPKSSVMHPTQQACRTDLQTALSVAQLNGQEVDVECDCTKPGEYPACKN